MGAHGAVPRSCADSGIGAEGRRDTHPDLRSEAPMPRQIIRFSVHQTAKVLALIYAVMGLVFIPIFLVMSMSNPGIPTPPVALALIFPIIYGVFGYVFVGLGCIVYNAVAGKVGGIEVEVAA
jgi:hypothetical protein